MTCGCDSIILLLSAVVACMSAEQQHGGRPTYVCTCSAAVSVARPGCGCSGTPSIWEFDDCFNVFLMGNSACRQNAEP